MKKRTIMLFFAMFVFVFITVDGLFFGWKEIVKPPSNNNINKSFVIEKGTSAQLVGDKLVKQGLIKSSLAFKFYVQVTNKTKKIQAGEYRLSSNLTLYEIVEKLEKGPSEIWITIPEGLRREELVERFIKGFELNMIESERFRNEFLKESEDKEGFLFPDTYLFPKTASASAIINRQVSTFEKKVEPKIRDGFNKSKLELKDAIILASLIERETKTDEERSIVAGILLKRLRKGWPLQIDATVQYIVGTDFNWWPQISKENLNINSLYNTYKFIGLPPNPIANPGLSSINAVANPKDTSFWFYLHDKFGNIHYAETVSEHNQNIRIYLDK